MTSTATIFCTTCQSLRSVHDWHERREALLIELEPCGHVMLKNARVEWLVRRQVA